MNYARSLLAVIFWLFIAWMILDTIPYRAYDLKQQGLFILGIIGIWRYGWHFLHVFRWIGYNAFKYPSLRENLKDELPGTVFFIIPSYKEQFYVTEKVFNSLKETTKDVRTKIVAIVSVGTQEEIDSIKSILCPTISFELRFQLQTGEGKRSAIANMLRDARTIYNWVEENDVVVFMDGDTILSKDSLSKCLSFFTTYPKLGGVTTNEEGRYTDDVGELSRRWYDLKFAKRNHYMSSHSLSGRYSIVRAVIAFKEDFINLIEKDVIKNSLVGEVTMLMGDDKTTAYKILSEGWDSLYLPDVYVYPLENRSDNFVDLSIDLMGRWYGNMLRNNARSIKLGPWRMPFFIWICLLDQRVSMWTTLVGPIGVGMLSLFVSWHYLLFYICWVIVTRLLQLCVLIPQGFCFRIIHLPLVVWDQWMGALVKTYCIFNLHRQRWAKLEEDSGIDVNLSDIVALFVMLFYYFLFANVLAVITGIFSHYRWHLF